MRRAFRLVGALLSSACVVSCGSSDSHAVDKGGKKQCEAIEVCGAITLDHINTVCGLSLNDISSITVYPASSDMPMACTCNYAGSPFASIEHLCFSSASIASSYFTNEKDHPLGGEAQADITGIGDRAF